MNDSPFTPKHDYQTVLEDLRRQILEVPKEIVDWSYAFRDAMVKLHKGTGDFTKTDTKSLAFPLRAGHFNQSTHIEYVVTVKGYWVSHRHDEEWCESLELKINNGFANGFGRIDLPWNRREYGKPKKK